MGLAVSRSFESSSAMSSLNHGEITMTGKQTNIILKKHRRFRTST
jgi:hypothetical protein